MADRRVVVTGMGAVTPLGNSVRELWEGLVAGRSGIGPITRFDADEYAVRIAAEVRDFDPDAYIDPRESRRMDPFVQYGVAAAKMALEDAGLEITEGMSQRTGVLVGSGIGGVRTWEEQHRALLERGPRRVSPLFIPMLICDMAAGTISIIFGAKGPNMTIVTACATGSHCIGEACKIIQRGQADVMIAGGTEASVVPTALAGFAAAKALSSRNDDPERASRPFDANRDGFVIGEGAGIVVLEELEFAKRRGARIYAEVAGFGLSGDAYHVTQPAPGGEGAAMAMQMALDDAGVPADEVDHINAHGTATPLGDIAETIAIKRVFGERAYQIPVTANKSMIGHLLGAAGGVEFIVTVLTVVSGVIPPTINIDTPDPECDLDYVPWKPREARVRAALCNSFGFGGHNSALLVRAFED
ncbi:MAG: beta-ketoacyl-ACP synthase II [Armatimonadota bacterium]